MIDTISRIEAWAAVAASRLTSRAAGADPSGTDEVQRVVDQRRQEAKASGVPAVLPLELLLAQRPRQYANLSGDAAIVDLWTAQLLSPPAQPCRCEHSFGGGHKAGPAEKLQQIETRVVTQLLNTYRTITRTNTGRLIDVVV